jgi:DNA-binding NtrC family response regulator
MMLEEFHDGIKRISGETPGELLCLADSSDLEAARQLLSGSELFKDSPCEVVFVELAFSLETQHRQLWDSLIVDVLPQLEKRKGNTFHIDSSSAGLIAHAVWVMLLYAGQLTQPVNIWTRSTAPSGAVRFVLLQLPLESLNLKLRKIEGDSRKAIYQREKIQSPVLRASLDLIVTASRIPSLPLLLLGEKGTGKTRLVESVLGAVRGRTVHTILCGSLQTELAMSQLFGHVKGAFTGADKDAPGLIGEASGGILFFDEIQDLPRTVQRMLVRFLQDPDHLYRRVGSSGKESKADVELIFASHKNAGELSSLLDPDLYDRISLVTVWIPSLREFREDLPEIWRQVWLEHGRIADIVVDPRHHALLSWFASFDFPGNLRDLISMALWIQVYYLQFQSIDAAILEAIRRTGHSFGTVDLEESLKLDYMNTDLPLKQRISLFRKSLVREAMSKYGTSSSTARALRVDEKTIRNIMTSDIASEL